MSKMYKSGSESRKTTAQCNDRLFEIKINREGRKEKREINIEQT